MSKTAIITGVTGQDGSYLADLLLSKGYIVVGVGRRCSHHNTERIDDISDARFTYVEGDITDYSFIIQLLTQHAPVCEVYNLAAQSHVGKSFDIPLYTWDVVAKGTLNILEAIRYFDPSIRFYQASSSEMFGSQLEINELGVYQDENTRMIPNSPYAIAKLAAYHATRLYREAYDIYACNGILFNHESFRRGTQFVTRKITTYIAKLVADQAKGVDIEAATYPKLKLGYLGAKRDWGWAPDYVMAMWLMMQRDEPDDYVIGTGETHTVEEFVTQAFDHVNLNWKDYVEIDKSLYRPKEVPYLCSRPEKALKQLGWKPSIAFDELVRHMVEAEIAHV